MRIDIFQAKVNAEKNISMLSLCLKNRIVYLTSTLCLSEASGEWDKLSAESKRLVEKMILEGKRNGLSLPEKERTELMALQKDLSQTCLEFSKNFNEEKASISNTSVFVLG
jgi:Zn-dependent oligopeptidase